MITESPHDGKMKCAAKTRAGTPCQQIAGWGTDHVGNGRCKLHGGKSLGGIASATFQNGRYSKYLPGRVIVRYKLGISDDQLLVLADEIALIDARLADLLSRVDSGENGALWANLITAWRELKSAVRTGNREEQTEHAATIDIIINQAKTDYQAWGEIHALIDQRRRMVESERKRLVEIQQMITAKEAMTLIAAIQGIVLEHVTDKTTIRNISAAVNALAAS
jgi:hypothetical protein